MALAVVAGVAATLSYQQAGELVSSDGEDGVAGRLLPFTVDGLIWAASMVVLDASRVRVMPMFAEACLTASPGRFTGSGPEDVARVQGRVAAM
jgi:hypothetical protein